MPFNQTSFRQGHKRSKESIEKQRNTLKLQYAAGLRSLPSRPIGIPNKWQVKICETCDQRYEPRGQGQRWCRVCSPDFNWSRRIFRYGITKPMWDEMLLEQNGTCALCDKIPTSIDHNHATGVVRGLLCHSCNFRLSAIEDKEWRKRAEKYVTVC